MDTDSFLALTEDRGPRPSERAIRSFEKEIGASLPSDYRAFLERCNGGYAGGLIWHVGQSSLRVGIQHVGGLRQDEEDYSLQANRQLYQVENRWIPSDLLWIMDDPVGNATCLGIRGVHRGRTYFWDHEAIPNEWDGQVETAGNVTLIARSFAAFLDACVEDAEQK